VTKENQRKWAILISWWSKRSSETFTWITWGGMRRRSMCHGRSETKTNHGHSKNRRRLCGIGFPAERSYMRTLSSVHSWRIEARTSPSF
jgi:hypothetical protein